MIKANECWRAADSAAINQSSRINNRSPAGKTTGNKIAAVASSIAAAIAVAGSTASESRCTKPGSFGPMSVRGRGSPPADRPANDPPWRARSRTNTRYRSSVRQPRIAVCNASSHEAVAIARPHQAIADKFDKLRCNNWSGASSSESCRWVSVELPVSAIRRTTAATMSLPSPNTLWAPPSASTMVASSSLLDGRRMPPNGLAAVMTSPRRRRRRGSRRCGSRFPRRRS